VLFAALVAYGAWYVQFRLFRTNGLLWSLATFSLMVPLIDRVLPGSKYRWEQRHGETTRIRGGVRADHGVAGATAA
jgi:hypothetical protein